MNPFSRLTEKSWQTPGVEIHANAAQDRPTASTVGLYVYFGVATVIFTLIAAAYLVRMGMPGGMAHGAGGDWRPMPEPHLLWINTAILAGSSLAWELARLSARRGVLDRMRTMAIAGGMLGLAFLAGQLLLWEQYQAAGYYLASNPANAFFYLLTAIHGLHLAGGLCACARTLGQIGGQLSKASIARNFGLCATYWHFLLLVWLVLAGLLAWT